MRNRREKKEQDSVTNKNLELPLALISNNSKSNLLLIDLLYSYTYVSKKGTLYFKKIVGNAWFIPLCPHFSTSLSRHLIFPQNQCNHFPAVFSFAPNNIGHTYLVKLLAFEVEKSFQNYTFVNCYIWQIKMPVFFIYYLEPWSISQKITTLPKVHL